jgi:hypothetical protein
VSLQESAGIRFQRRSTALSGDRRDDAQMTEFETMLQMARHCVLRSVVQPMSGIYDVATAAAIGFVYGEPRRVLVVNSYDVAPWRDDRQASRPDCPNSAPEAVQVLRYQGGPLLNGSTGQTVQVFKPC